MWVVTASSSACYFILIVNITWNIFLSTAICIPFFLALCVHCYPLSTINKLNESCLCIPIQWRLFLLILPWRWFFILPFFIAPLTWIPLKMLLFYFLILLMAVTSARSETLRPFSFHWSSSCRISNRKRAVSNRKENVCHLCQFLFHFFSVDSQFILYFR